LNFSLSKKKKKQWGLPREDEPSGSRSRRSSPWPPQRPRRPQRRRRRSRPLISSLSALGSGRIPPPRGLAARTGRTRPAVATPRSQGTTTLWSSSSPRAAAAEEVGEPEAPRLLLRYRCCSRSTATSSRCGVRTPAAAGASTAERSASMSRCRRKWMRMSPMPMPRTRRNWMRMSPASRRRRTGVSALAGEGAAADWPR
jgi:hypothetical protein